MAEISQMIKQLEDERRLDKSEMSFIESVSEQYEDRGALATGQINRLKQIYDKYNN